MIQWNEKKSLDDKQNSTEIGHRSSWMKDELPPTIILKRITVQMYYNVKMLSHWALTKLEASLIIFWYEIKRKETMQRESCVWRCMWVYIYVNLMNKGTFGCYEQFGTIPMPRWQEGNWVKRKMHWLKSTVTVRLGLRIWSQLKVLMMLPIDQLTRMMIANLPLLLTVGKYLVKKKYKNRQIEFSTCIGSWCKMDRKIK